MSIQYVAGNLRKYSMVSTFALLAVFGSADNSIAASMDAYYGNLAGGDAKASAVEAMQLLEDLSMNADSSPEDAMKMAEQLMTGAVAAGDERSVKWVAAAILKGAGDKNFNAAELGIRLVVDGSRYQSEVAQVSREVRELMNVPVSSDGAMVASMDDSAATGSVESAGTEEDRSFFAELFDINRSSWSFSNRVGIRHDSNIYANESEESGMVYTDTVNMSLSASSTRSALQVFYKPTLTISPEKEVGDTELYQDFVGLLSHELSERNVLRVKETFRLQEDEDLYGTSGSVDNSYWKNGTTLSLDRAMRGNNRLSVFGTAEFKRYSESAQEDKDYKAFTVGTSYSKTLSDRTFATSSLSYTAQEYDKAIVNKDNSVFFLGTGLSHQLNPDLVAQSQVGVQFVQPDNSQGEDKLVPYFDGSLTYYISPKTTVSGSFKYFYDKDSSAAYALGSESFKFALTGRHNFTEKMLLSASVGHTDNTYPQELSGYAFEAKTKYDDFTTRLTYKISRIHSVDAGYTFRATDGEVTDYDRQQVDMGWTVKF